MRFEDIRVGMQFKVIREFYLLKVGDVAYVKVKDDEDKSVYVEKLWSHEGHWIGSNFGNYLEAIQEKPCAAQEAIDYIKKHFGRDEYETILFKHQLDPQQWRFELRGLKGLPIDQLRKLLFGQNIVVQDKPSVPEHEQQTNLQPTDYMSMVDIALMIGDKEWFNELLQKSNEGAIS